MFWIGFTNEPIQEAEPGEIGSVGLMALGDHEERFVAHFWNWSKQNYIFHWETALLRLMQGKPSALITDMRTPLQSSHLVWWPMWLINNEVLIQNQLLFFASHGIKGSKIDVEILYELIPKHTSHDNEGTPISEWRVAVEDVRRFLDSHCSCQ